MEIVVSLVIALLQSLLFYGKTIGISMLIFTIVTTLILWWVLNKKGKIIHKKAFLWLIPIISLSSSYFIFANAVFYILNILVISLLMLLMFTIATNAKEYFVGYLRNTLELIKSTLCQWGNVFQFTKESTNQIIKSNSKWNKEKIKKIVTSLAIVLGVVVIVIILLASADSIFASIFSGFSDMFFHFNEDAAWSLVFRISAIVIVYFISLGFILAIQNKKENNLEIKKSSNTTDKFTIKMLLIVLNIVYLVFCYIQISSLFAKMNLVGSFHYAEYARSGFFQLMAVSFINFALILISNRKNENRERIVKILNILLIIFTIIIVLSSMYRMYMYETEYGLTYLRSFVYIILIAELIAFIPTAIYIFNAKLDLLKWITIIGISIYTCINFVNFEGIIITKNIKVESRSVSTDYDYICKIASSDSYHLLVEIAENEKIETKDRLKVVSKLLRIVDRTDKLEWQEFNLSKYCLQKQEIDRKALEQQKKELVKKLEEENRKKEEYQYHHYIYEEMINEIEGYRVDQADVAMSDARWIIEKTIDGGNNYQIINELTLKTASKIVFFEDGLGFLEKPISVYCGEADLYVTYDSGKTFSKIAFPEGEFSLSNPNGKEWSECYDYYHLPTKGDDGSLIVLVSGGYEGGYNEGKTRAKYISKDNGRTWIFEGEIINEMN